jgi:hypothetical protein
LYCSKSVLIDTYAIWPVMTQVQRPHISKLASHYLFKTLFGIVMQILQIPTHTPRDLSKRNRLPSQKLKKPLHIPAYTLPSCPGDTITGIFCGCPSPSLFWWPAAGLIRCKFARSPSHPLVRSPAHPLVRSPGFLVASESTTKGRDTIIRNVAPQS